MTTNQLAYMANLETARANREREFETRRSNLANERESRRSNLAKENENIRSNLAREQENTRSNIAKEIFNQTDAHQKNMLTAQSMLNQYLTNSRQAAAAERNAETNRINSVTNQMNADTNRMQAVTSADTLSENIRHNVSMEDLKRLETTLDAFTSSLRAIGSII